MAHVRQQVREAAKARLEDTGAFDTVATNRGMNFGHHELPAASLQTFDEESALATKDGLEERAITLTASIMAQGADEQVADTLDDLAIQAERAIIPDEDDDLGGIAQRAELTTSELTLGTDEDGARWLGVLDMAWAVVVHTEQGDPETAI